MRILNSQPGPKLHNLAHIQLGLESQKLGVGGGQSKLPGADQWKPLSGLALGSLVLKIKGQLLANKPSTNSLRKSSPTRNLFSRKATEVDER